MREILIPVVHDSSQPMTTKSDWSSAHLIIDLDAIFYANCPAIHANSPYHPMDGKIYWRTPLGRAAHVSTRQLLANHVEYIVSHLRARAAQEKLAMFKEGAHRLQAVRCERVFWDLSALRTFPLRVPEYLAQVSGADDPERDNPFLTNATANVIFGFDRDSFALPLSAALIEEVTQRLDGHPDFVHFPGHNPHLVARADVEAVDFTYPGRIGFIDRGGTLLWSRVDNKDDLDKRPLTIGLAEVIPGYFTKPNMVTTLTVYHNGLDSYSLRITGAGELTVGGFTSSEIRDVFSKAVKTCQLLQLTKFPLAIAISPETVSDVTLTSQRAPDERTQSWNLLIGSTLKCKITEDEKKVIEKKLATKNYVSLSEGRDHIRLRALSATTLRGVIIGRKDQKLSLTSSAGVSSYTVHADETMVKIKDVVNRLGFLLCDFGQSQIVVDPETVTSIYAQPGHQPVQVEHITKDGRALVARVKNHATRKNAAAIKMVEAVTDLFKISTYHLADPNDFAAILNNDYDGVQLVAIRHFLHTTFLRPPALRKLLSLRKGGTPSEFEPPAKNDEAA